MTERPGRARGGRVQIHITGPAIEDVLEADGLVAGMLVWLLAKRGQIGTIPRGRLTLDWSQDEAGFQLLPKLEQSFERVRGAS